MTSDLTSFRSIPEPLRERACSVFEAAIAEVGFGPSQYHGSIPTDVPPPVAYKAWTLAVAACGTQPYPYDEWLRRSIVNNADRPEAQHRWRRYLALHGVPVPA